MESREESYRGKQNPMTPLKELAFSAHGGTMTEQERQKKEAGQRSEDATEGSGGEGDLCRLHEAFSKVSVKGGYGSLKIHFPQYERK